MIPFRTVRIADGRTVHAAFAVVACGQGWRQQLRDAGSDAVNCLKCRRSMFAARERDHAEAVSSTMKKVPHR